MIDLSSMSISNSRYEWQMENVLKSDVRVDEYSSGKDGVCNGVKGTGSERGNGQRNKSNRDQSGFMVCQRRILLNGWT